MTREEAIRITIGLRTDFKCESDTMVDFCNTVIEALEQEPTAKNDLGVDAIPREQIDKMIAEIKYHQNKTAPIDKYDLVGDCLDIIDKYKAESEGDND